MTAIAQERHWRATYSIVTPESAAHGDAAETGFIDACGDRVPCNAPKPVYTRLRDALEAIESIAPLQATLAYVEPSDSNIECARWMTLGFSPDYETGEQWQCAIHIPDHVSPASRRRLFNLLQS